jgi:hypothetical protein
MPVRWLQTDPRQREIHRLLQQLVGGEPAAFFLDACRLMDGDYRLEATTHVVGHLLRELDLVLRAVLRPIVPVDRWPSRDTPDANRKQIDAICDALGIGADDPFRELWREYARPLHEWAHRYSRAAPSPLDDGGICVQRCGFARVTRGRESPRLTRSCDLGATRGAAVDGACRRPSFVLESLAR